MLFIIFCVFSAWSRAMAQQMKIDSRVKILIENCIRTNQRSMFVVVGDTADYVVRI